MPPVVGSREGEARRQRLAQELGVDPDIDVIRDLPGSRDMVICVRCYVSECHRCCTRAWVFSGYVLYWLDTYERKGGMGYSPGATYCPSCAPDSYFAQGPGTMEAIGYLDQQAYHTAHRMGGEPAVLEMIKLWNDEHVRKTSTRR